MSIIKYLGKLSLFLAITPIVVALLSDSTTNNGKWIQKLANIITIAIIAICILAFIKKFQFANFDKIASIISLVIIIVFDLFISLFVGCMSMGGC